MKKYFLGCSGWFYWHWEGKFYPFGLNKNKWLSYYAKKFNSVEINSTFYHFPNEKGIKGWLRKVPNDFVFTVKGNRYISHIRKFVGTKEMIDKFYELIKPMGKQLGCVLWQLPPSLKYDLKKLDSIAKQLNSQFRNVIEFRHKSWYRKETYDFLKKKRISFCIVSAPGFPEDFIETTSNLYIRFHGRFVWYGSNYSKEELREWAAKIKKSRAKKIYCYFNNDANAYAPKNCLELKKLLF